MIKFTDFISIFGLYIVVYGLNIIFIILYLTNSFKIEIELIICYGIIILITFYFLYKDVRKHCCKKIENTENVV